ncbi:hypothetical protein EV421DRAFT_1740115 [Armillaria borealis]|uniref:Uncharacterized protein n=1 Tax=Armillaria borealis TaxID=47425 RepID=A0AA39J3W5_9AGAR|nr:hypothetical protein EV421DRAFT_1740115 [Armillaria borealis]
MPSSDLPEIPSLIPYATVYIETSGEGNLSRSREHALRTHWHNPRLVGGQSRKSLKGDAEGSWVPQKLAARDPSGSPFSLRYVGPPKPISSNCFSITIRTYPNTPIVRGNYNDDHSHPLGPAPNASIFEDLLWEKMSPGASKATMLAKTDDTHDECMTECDSSVDAWHSESALYPDDQDPFASIPMADVHLSCQLSMV